MGKRWRWVAWGALALGVAQAQAHSSEAEAEAGEGGLRLSGFGTLGLTYDRSPRPWGFRREFSQTGEGRDLRSDVDSRLGVQANYAWNERFELVGQLLAQRHSPYAHDSAPVEWAYLAYTPQAEWSLRLGRVNVDAFLMADYHNVGFAYVMARPPIEFYSVLPTSLDGMDVARTWVRGGVQWRAKLFAGKSTTGDLSVDAQTKSRIYGASLSRDADGLLARLGVARARLEIGPTQQQLLQPLLGGLRQLAQAPLPAVSQEAAALGRRLDFEGASAVFVDAGLRYESGPWQWSAEALRISGLPQGNMKAGYLSVGRRFGAVTLFGGLSAARSSDAVAAAPPWGSMLAPVLGERGAAQAQGLAAGAAQALNRQRVRQSTVSLGLRWDVHPQAALKLQWERIRVSSDGSQLWSNATLAAGRAQVTSVLLDFVF